LSPFDQYIKGLEKCEGTTPGKRGRRPNEDRPDQWRWAKALMTGNQVRVRGTLVSMTVELGDVGTDPSKTLPTLQLVSEGGLVFRVKRQRLIQACEPHD
jgi:hypothetical protein